MQIDLNTLEMMAVKRHKSAGGAWLEHDFRILMHIFNSHFMIKNEWRQNDGVLRHS
jgi:hypothetical protein